MVRDPTDATWTLITPGSTPCFFGTTNVRAQLVSNVRQNLVITPRRCGVWLFVVIRPKQQVPGREQNLFDVWILPHFGPGSFDDQAIVFARFFRAIRHLFAFKRHPTDFHGLHIPAAEIAGPLGVESRKLRNLIPRVLPTNPRGLGSWIIRSFRILHHLPEALKARITLSPVFKRRCSEIG